MAECLPSLLTIRIERSGVTVKIVYSPSGREWFSTLNANGMLTVIRRWLVVWAERVMAAAVNNRQIVIWLRRLFIGISPFLTDRPHFAANAAPAQWAGSDLGLGFLCLAKALKVQAHCHPSVPFRCSRLVDAM